MSSVQLAIEKSMELSDEVIADFNEVVADTEALLQATASQGGEKLAEVRARAERSLKVVKARMVQTQSELLGKARAAAKATDAYAHENPWQAIGIAGGVGMLVGWLVSRR
jgi:ElaB/YqjD/DUF883 family membrane-anchored ribosome-binding protein